MSEFGDEVKAIRIMLAEQGVEVNLEILLDVLEGAVQSREERECFRCKEAEFGLCFPCLKEKIQEMYP